MASKRVRFRKTDGLTSLLTGMLREYYAGRGGASRKDLRKMRSQMLVAIADGVESIPIKKVAARR